MEQSELQSKIRNRQLICGAVGLGYVGLPLAVAMASAGYKTIGYDVSAEKVALVNLGENYIGDIEDSTLARLVELDLLEATNDVSKIRECDFVTICVPTPLDRHQQPETSYMEESTKAIAPYLKKGAMIVLESTTYPGTTEDLIRPIIETESGMKCGTDFYLAFSPERVDPGNPIYKTNNTPKVVGAIGKEALDSISSVYDSFLEGEIVRVSSPAIAEMEKILENTYRNVNIGLINEMAMLCDRMRINIWEVIDAAKTKPYGFTAFYPGPGLGGHCIPLDPYYLSWKAREYGFHTSMIESSMMINDKMPEYCADRIARALNDAGKAVNGSDVLILGVAYKRDIDDYRESPALRLIEELKKRSASVSYYDPWIPEYKYKDETMHSAPCLSENLLDSADIVVIACDHSNVDYEKVQQHSRIVFDTRNATKQLGKKENIILL